MRDMRKRGVSAPVLFISGTPDTLAVLQSAGISDTYFLGKPFSTGDFSQALSALLG
jgi:FixJ family two-component response regulator